MVLLTIGTMQFRRRILRRRAAFAFSLPLARHVGPGPYTTPLQTCVWSGDRATSLPSCRCSYSL